jgi:glucose 1-dehydrogenase
MYSLLNGKVAIVTGASSGIGRAIARKFSAEGASVVIADIVPEPLEGGETTLAQIARDGGEALFEQADVSKWEDIDRLVSSAVRHFGRLDVMVNNAAIYSSTALLETTEAQWRHVLDVNLTGMFNGCKRAVQQMLTQRAQDDVRGRIINLGSQQGIVTAPRDTPYGVSKAGAIYLTKQIAVDYAEQGIVCNSVSPGKIVTGAPGMPTDPKLLENARRRTPWPRLGRPEDIANAATFLASDLATYITGANLVVDGGWLAR